MSSGKRIVVVGAGAIGGYTGALMARGGEDVTLVDLWPEHVEYIRANGMQLSGLTPAETYSIKVNARHIGDVQQFAREKPIDIAFISVKSYDTEWATHLIKPYLAPGGYVEIGRASCRERVEMSVVAVALKRKACEVVV